MSVYSAAAEQISSGTHSQMNTNLVAETDFRQVADCSCKKMLPSFVICQALANPKTEHMVQNMSQSQILKLLTRKPSSLLPQHIDSEVPSICQDAAV